MSKQKIAFVVAIPGTAKAFLKDHFSKLTEKYDVSLIANFPLEESKQEYREMGVSCYTVPIERPINIFKDIKALLALYCLFRTEHFVSVHSVTPKAALLTACAGWLAKIPYRIHIYTGQVWATQKGIMRMLLKGMDNIVSILNTHLLVDGEGQRQFLINEGILTEKNSAVLANGSIAGVKLERFVISEEVRERERTKFGFTNDDVVYIFLGRLNHDKGIGELYIAFNKLIANSPKAKLLLYGTDEENYEAKATKHKNLIRNVNFYYPGRTNTPYEALQCGDVFVLPTWREGFGMSVIEAQGLALPVITSDAYGVVDASIEGVTGLRCKVGDADSLYEAMKRYYDNPEMRKQHGLAGRKRVEDLFDNKVVTAAWLDFYDKLLTTNSNDNFS